MTPGGPASLTFLWAQVHTAAGRAEAPDLHGGVRRGSSSRQPTQSNVMVLFRVVLRVCLWFCLCFFFKGFVYVFFRVLFRVLLRVLFRVAVHPFLSSRVVGVP